MTLDEALSALDEEDPQAIPAINRRYGVCREALLLAGEDELVARLDKAFAVVSTHYWSVVEPSRRAGYDERLAHRSAQAARAEQQQEADRRELVRSRGWPDCWPVRDAHIWSHRRIPVEQAVRWAEAGWPAELVLDFYLNGSEEWADLGLDPALLEADVLTGRLPAAPGDDWTRCRVGSLASVYAFESRGWSADDVAQVGADVAMMCLAGRYSFEQLRAFAALGFRGRKAIGLIDAGVLVGNLVGWDPPFVYRLLDVTDPTHRHRLNDLLAVPGGNRPEDNLKEIKASDSADWDAL